MDLKYKPSGGFKLDNWIDILGLLYANWPKYFIIGCALDKYSDMKAKIFDWYDVGTVDNYIKAKNLFKDIDYKIYLVYNYISDDFIVPDNDGKNELEALTEMFGDDDTVFFVKGTP